MVSKLHSKTAIDLDRRHYRAAKALVIIMPVLGLTYLLTLLGPSARDRPTAYKVFQAIRAALLSSQGAVITLPYCYLNTEVQGILMMHWNRWKTVRMVDMSINILQGHPLELSLVCMGRYAICGVNPQTNKISFGNLSIIPFIIAGQDTDSLAGYVRLKLVSLKAGQMEEEDARKTGRRVSFSQI